MYTVDSWCLIAIFLSFSKLILCFFWRNWMLKLDEMIGKIWWFWYNSFCIQLKGLNIILSKNGFMHACFHALDEFWSILFSLVVLK